MTYPDSNSHSDSNLEQLESTTINHYDRNALSFWHGTKDHDVTQNYDAFLNALPPDNVLDILDLGCGPGRDIHYFKTQGHRPIGLDGCATFCEMARKNTGCHVLHQRFLNLELPNAAFDGVFANASLFHVPSKHLHSVLRKINHCLKSNGILFMSNPRGSSEGWSNQRYGHYMEIGVAEHYLQEAQFNILHHYYRPEGQPREQQPWLAIVSQKDEQ